LPDNLGHFKYKISQTENSLQISSGLVINTAVFPAEKYQELKDFYKKMIKKQAEKIVFVKK